MSWAAIGVAVGGAALSAGVAAASAPNFHNPNLANSSREIVLADLVTLPGRRMLENAARLGTAVDYPTGRSVPIYGPETSTVGGQSIRKIIGYKAQIKHADFTGKGDADVQSELAGHLAELSLGTEQKYGAQFAQEARHQAELSNPLGYAARKTLYDELVKRDEAGAPASPVAGAMDAQILGDLQRGRSISPEQQAIIEEVQARRGGADAGVTADVAGSMERGPEAEARLQRAQQHALGFLSSGATPEDVEYRRTQQSLADMGHFLGGRTPEAEFGSLSGAQRGTTPQFRAPSLPGPDPNAAQIGQQGALTNYNQQVRNATGQVNDWFAGLSAVVRGAGAVAAGSNPR